MSDLLGKAFSLANNSLFKVKIYINDKDDTKEFLELTYMKLGTYLITNQSEIKRIDIILKKRKIKNE